MQDSVFVCMGYTCLCGEKVTVFRIPTSTPSGNRIRRKTVTCKNGHVRVVTVDQLRMLDYWIEEEELATGT
jgi:hypothetical protein